MKENTNKYNEKFKMYESDFIRFEKFCKENSLGISFDSLLIYLRQCVTQNKIKLSTYCRRMAGIKYYLQQRYKLNQTIENKNQFDSLRALYNKAEFISLKTSIGVKCENKEEVLQLINRYNTDIKSDIRKRAICLVNLITANRPSEMVRIKVSDFDLENYKVHIPIKNQSVNKEKHLTSLCVQAVKKYIDTCELKGDDYFVGATDRWGNYTSRQISEISYNQAIQKWLGFAPSAFRKTQIIAMYQSGADIPTIAQQTGHKSHQTIMQHYITKKAIDIDEFL